MPPDNLNRPWRTLWTLPRGDASNSALVVVTEDHVHHFYNGHVKSPRLPQERHRWADFLTAEFLARLGECWAAPQAARNVVLDELAARLETEVRHALVAPLFVEYEELDLSEKHRHDSMELVTPAGLIVVLRRGTLRLALQTAFFPDVGDDVRPNKLRKEAVRDLVNKYAARLVYASFSYRTLPPAEHKVPIWERGQMVGWRTGIRFIEPGKWGFRQRVLPGPPAPPEWVW